MGDKSPKAKNKTQKQGNAVKEREKAAMAAKAASSSATKTK